MPINEELLAYRIFFLIDTYYRFMDDNTGAVQACTDAIMDAVLEEFGVE